MSDLAARLSALEHRVGELEDINAIRRLHWAYGYYIDFNRAEDVVQLFAKDGAVVFLSGEYCGHDGVRRLYGTWFQNFFTHGVNGPVHGFLLDHFQMQDIITVAPDRQTAKGRFRGLLMGGCHESREYKPEGLPLQFYEAGLYENDYVREGAVWKIKRLDYMMQWQADYEKGWSKTVAHLQPATETYPKNPLGPDVLLPAGQVRKTWPHRQDVPMHFAHPRFGAVLAGRA
ncbi:MAG TPA: nuclear transport factor 2 family protein [Steroidobacteraceae bacterium]|nr:nuclear transport factor 2 family protein [Steroidobacteraceae bacterium]